MVLSNDVPANETAILERLIEVRSLLTELKQNRAT